MVSTVDEECVSIYINAFNAVPFIITLWELGHPQQLIPIQTNNSTAYGIMNTIQSQMEGDKPLCPIYLYEEGKSPNSLQGCVEILKLAKTPDARHK